MTKLTHTDIDLAKIYFELLVAVAKGKPGQTIEYGELVTLAKNTYPDNEAVKGATAVSTGRRLGTLRDKFTKPNKLPDLSALVVNKSTGNNGGVYTQTFDAETLRAEISAFDWSTVQHDFDNFIATEKLAVQNRPSRSTRPVKVKEPEARQILWDYYQNNKAQIGLVNQPKKEAIIRLIMQGHGIEHAIEQVCA
jgi:hypothetical protein